jgi:hypothetical protein
VGEVKDYEVKNCTLSSSSSLLLRSVNGALPFIQLRINKIFVPDFARNKATCLSVLFIPITPTFYLDFFLINSQLGHVKLHGKSVAFPPSTEK